MARECDRCGSKMTYTGKDGRPQWHAIRVGGNIEGYLCNRCNSYVNYVNTTTIPDDLLSPRALMLIAIAERPRGRRA